jgi:hypothetical protein
MERLAMVVFCRLARAVLGNRLSLEKKRESLSRGLT